MANTITLHLEGDEISAQAFHQKVGAFLNMLRAIDRSYTQDLNVDATAQQSVRWIVESIHAGSPVDMTLRPVPLEGTPLEDMPVPVGGRIIDIGAGGLALVESATPMHDPPRFFTIPVLEAVRDLARPSNDGVAYVQIRTEEQSITLTPRATVNLDRFLRPVFEYRGTVEGVLQMVSVAGRPHFSVRDPVSDRAIRCTVPRSRLGKVVSAFDRRVVVTGQVKTNERGDILSIRAEEIEAFPHEEDLPGLQDVAGRFDITRGKTIREHLESLWDAS
jgi:hypothetical protein